MSSNINRNLPGYAYDAATTANTPSGTNPYATIADLPQAVSSGTQLLTGGASWSGTGMDFDVSDLTYLINGINYSSSATTVTLSVGDPSDPRFDAIVVDEFGVVSVITGTPAANPLIPTVPTDQVLVQYVLVNAGAVTPSITNSFVYRESQAGDWAGFVSGAAPAPTANFTSATPTPFQGAACLLASYSVYSGTRYVGFTAPSPLVRANYAAVSLRVYLPQALPGLDGLSQGRRPAMMVRSGTSSLGFRYLDQHGLNPNLTGTWQLVTIPLGFFNGAANLSTITSIRLFLVEFVSTTPVYIDIAYDDIKFQTGFGPQSNIATVDLLENAAAVGSTAKLNFISGAGVEWSLINDAINNRINVAANSVNAYVTPELNLVGRSLIPDDAGKFLMVDSATPTTMTIQLNSTFNIPVGAVIKISQQGTGNVTINGVPGVNLYNGGGTTIPGQYSVATVTKTDTDTWYLEFSLV